MKAALMRKLGPLPAAAWLAILAGAVYFYRRFNATASATTTTATDTGSAAATPGGFGTPAVGGGGDSGLAPDQSSPLGTADPGLSGVGTPVIFDPATGQYGTLDGSGNFISGPDQGVFGNQTGTIGGRDQVAPPVAFGGVKAPKLPKVTLPRPKKTTGTASAATKKPATPTAATVAHPASSHTKAPAARRVVIAHAAPAPARPRVAATAPVARQAPKAKAPPPPPPPPRPAPKGKAPPPAQVRHNH